MENLKYLVLDEADRLLEDEFMRDLRDISEVEKFPKVCLLFIHMFIIYVL